MLIPRPPGRPQSSLRALSQEKVLRVASYSTRLGRTCISAGSFFSREFIASTHYQEPCHPEGTYSRKKRLLPPSRLGEIAQTVEEKPRLLPPSPPKRCRLGENLVIQESRAPP